MPAVSGVARAVPVASQGQEVWEKAQWVPGDPQAQNPSGCTQPAREPETVPVVGSPRLPAQDSRLAAAPGSRRHGPHSVGTASACALSWGEHTADLPGSHAASHFKPVTQESGLSAVFHRRQPTPCPTRRGCAWGDAHLGSTRQSWSIPPQDHCGAARLHGFLRGRVRHPDPERAL